jgi:hypothetical protein
MIDPLQKVGDEVGVLRLKEKRQAGLGRPTWRF